MSTKNCHTQEYHVQQVLGAQIRIPRPATVISLKLLLTLTPTKENPDERKSAGFIILTAHSAEAADCGLDDLLLLP